MLADLLEQARGHSAPDDRGIDLRDVKVGIAIAGVAERQGEMCLFQVLDHAPFTAAEKRGFGAGSRPRCKPAEQTLGRHHQRVVVDVPGGGQDQVFGAVEGIDEPGQIRPGKGRDPLGRAEDRAAHRLAGKN